MKLSENESWVKNFTFDLNKQERELSEVQKKLAVEEEVLAEIQESLQGNLILITVQKYHKL